MKVELRFRNNRITEPNKHLIITLDGPDKTVEALVIAIRQEIKDQAKKAGESYTSGWLVWEEED